MSWKALKEQRWKTERSEPDRRATACSPCGPAVFSKPMSRAMKPLPTATANARIYLTINKHSQEKHKTTVQ